MILYGNIPHSGRSQSSTPSRVRCSGDPWFRMAGCDLVANNLRCGAREDEDILTTSGPRMSQTRTPCVHLTGGCHGSRHPAYLPTSVIPETCVAGCPRTRCLATGDFAYVLWSGVTESCRRGTRRYVGVPRTTSVKYSAWLCSNCSSYNSNPFQTQLLMSFLIV